MAALFALCLLLPMAAFAVTPAPAHCLSLGEAPQAASESHHHDAGDQAHHASMAHEHAGHGAQTTAHGEDTAVPAKCCGLFCVSGLTPPAFGAADRKPIAIAAIALPVTASLFGRAAGGIDRPPRSLPPL